MKTDFFNPDQESDHMKERLLHGDVTDAIIKAYYHVYNALGPGFLERVYEQALLITLRKAGFTVEKHYPVKVYFEGVVVGQYFADLLVNRCVIIENKAIETLTPHDDAQLVN
jgi:GxxExxY protein